MTAQELEKLSWFWKLVQSILRSHAKNANLEFFQRKYPGLPAEIIAARRIETASKFAGLIGFASGATISVASLTAVTSAVGTVASGFVGSPVTVPALAVSLPVMGIALGAEVGLLIRIQLHLAYDLFVLNGLPVDIEDPERMQEVMQVAFGIKSAEISGQAIQKVLAQVAPQLLRKVMRTGLIRRKIQELVAKKLSWAFARKYLGEGILIKALVPGIAIFTATWWDYTSTKAIGKTLQAKIRRRGLAVKEAEKLNLEQFDDPKIILQSVLLLTLSNGSISETELTFYSRVVERLRHLHGEEVVNSLGEVTSLEWDDIVVTLADVTDIQQRRAIYDILVTAIVVGGNLDRLKRKRLENLAELYGLTFDKERIKVKCKAFEEPKRARTCLFTILALFVLMLFTCVLCSLGAIWLPTQ